MSKPKTKRVRMLRPTASVTFSYRRGKEYDLPAKKADEFIASGRASYVPTKAEVLAEAAKELGVDLVTTRRDVAVAASAIGWGDRVSLPKPKPKSKE